MLKQDNKQRKLMWTKIVLVEESRHLTEEALKAYEGLLKVNEKLQWLCMIKWPKAPLMGHAQSSPNLIRNLFLRWLWENRYLHTT